MQVTARPLAVQLQLPLLRVPVQFGTIPAGNWSRTVMTPAGTFGGLPVGTLVVLLIVSVYWVPAAVVQMPPVALLLFTTFSAGAVMVIRWSSTSPSSATPVGCWICAALVA